MRRSFSDRMDGWIFNSFRVTTEGLALYRIFVALMILFFLMPPSAFYFYLGALPEDFYHPPPGPMMLFGSFPPAELLWFFHFLLTASLICMLVGFYTRWSSLLSGFLMLLLKGFIFSIGKINHDLLISLVPLIFAFSSWGKAYSVDAVMTDAGRLKGGKDAVHDGWTLSLLALFIGFMFFTAGLPKILGGWLDLSTQATRGHFLNQYFPKDRTDLLADTALGIENAAFWEFLDIATIVFEVGFLAAIFHPVSTRLFICIAVVFHFSTMMIMNIAFLFNFIAYAAFLNWSWIDLKLRSAAAWLESGRFDKFTERAKAAHAVHAAETATFDSAENSFRAGHLSESWVSGMRPAGRGLLWGGVLIVLFTIITITDSRNFLVGQSDLVFYEILLLSVAFLTGVYGFYSQMRLLLKPVRR